MNALGIPEDPGSAYAGGPNPGYMSSSGSEEKPLLGSALGGALERCWQLLPERLQCRTTRLQLVFSRSYVPRGTPQGHNRGDGGQRTSTEDKDVTGKRAEALFKGGVISVAPLVQQTRMRPDFVSWEPQAFICN